MTARESRAVSSRPFLQVELPGPRLAREQAPLQAVGKPADDAVELGELLVELIAQPGQLLAVAEVGGADDLVELGGERLVGRLPARPVAPPGWRRRRPGLVVLLALAHRGVGVLVGRVVRPRLSSSRVGVRLAVAVGIHRRRRAPPRPAGSNRRRPSDRGSAGSRRRPGSSASSSGRSRSLDEAPATARRTGPDRRIARTSRAVCLAPLVSNQGRHRSAMWRADCGSRRPVSFSRMSMASASAIGTSSGVEHWS